MRIGAHSLKPSLMDVTIGIQPTLGQAWLWDGPTAAICVQDVDVQGVLQFTLIHTVGCALHRHTSRVIHRSKLSLPSLNQKRSEYDFFAVKHGGGPAVRPWQTGVLATLASKPKFSHSYVNIPTTIKVVKDTSERIDGAEFHLKPTRTPKCCQRCGSQLPRQSSRCNNQGPNRYIQFRCTSVRLLLSLDLAQYRHRQSARLMSRACIRTPHKWCTPARPPG